MLDFFPSRILTLYLARTFILRIVAMLGMLVMVLMMLDLLGETGNILAVPGNGEAELLRYVSLRLPQLIARFLPYSVLLATIITLATMNANSEVVAMKAAGLSAHQILAPLLLTAGLVAIASFAFNERVVTRAAGALKAWQAVEYAAVPPEPEGRQNVSFSDGSDVLMASRMHGLGDRTVMEQVSFYRLDDTGMIRQQLRAERATFVNPGWRLEGARVFDVPAARVLPGPSTLVVGEGISLAQVALRRVDPEAETLRELGASIAALAAAGRRTAELEAKWWHKIVNPLSSVLMPLLGAVAGFGLARSGKLFVRAVVGMMLGFAYFVVDNAALAMASFGGYPPLLAAWAPFTLFFLVGEMVLIRTEE